MDINSIEVMHEEIKLSEEEIIKELSQMFVGQNFHHNTCGHACLSMITGESVESLQNLLQKNSNLSMKNEMFWYLKHKGYKVKLIEQSDVTFDNIPNNSIIRLETPNNIGHFILKKYNKFLDPLNGIILKYIGVNKITHYMSFNR